jgi:hypothetical protein
VIADTNCAACVKNETEQVPLFYPNTMHLHMRDMNDLTITAINKLPQAKGFLSGEAHGPGGEARSVKTRCKGQGVRAFLPVLDAFKSAVSTSWL